MNDLNMPFTASDKRVDLDALEDHVGHGDCLAVGGGLSSRVPMATVRAILRRANNRTGKGSLPDELIVGPINLHTGTHLVHVAGKSVPLTGAEFRVLEILMRSAGQVISREAMTEQALGRKLVAYDRSIDTHLSNLRRKLDLEAGKNPEIKNVRGSGYTLTWADA